ncbi:MAG TPA: enoyl-CoA hydratase/isomerase family protein [Pseudonocardia sp.]|jgi:enoyl-CoA hydratase/carnithine racemase
MPDVTNERHGPIAVITLNRPEQRNSVSGTMLADLLRAFEEADADDAVRVIVTVGAGSTYCVGADLDHVTSGVLDKPATDLVNDDDLGGDKGTGPLSPHRRLLEQLGIGRWTQRMVAVTTPSVAAINGACGGGGLAIAVLQDFRIAAAGARIIPGFLSVGVGPEMGISYLLPRLIGWQPANRLLLTNPTLAAEEAHRIGLVDEVVPADRTLEEAMAYAERLAAQPPIAVRATKQLLRHSAWNSFDQQLQAEYHTQLMLFGLPETRVRVARLRDRIRGR